MAGDRNGRVTPVDNNRNSGKTPNRDINQVEQTKTKSKNIKITKHNSSNKNNHLPGVEDQTQNMELQDMCRYRPKSEPIFANVPCCAKLYNIFCFKVILFLVFLAFEVADVFSDWFLYYHVSAAEEGLVYGPPAASLRYSLLVFSIIGSLTFPFEVSNFWFEVFRSNPWVDVDLMSAIIIWIEDVPQITINVFIFACREEAISYFQLVKASLVIIGSVIRFIIFLIRYCDKNARFDMECAGVNLDSRRHVVYRCFIMIGCLFTIAGATVVFLFTQSERNPDGSLNFKIPNSLIEGEYDDQKYFQNVSIYFSHEMFDARNVKTVDELNLVRLLKINDIKRQTTEQTIRIQYDLSAGQRKFIIDTKDSIEQSVECFQANAGTDDVTFATDCTRFIQASSMKEIIFTFRYIKASIPELIFGDISFNARFHENSSVPVCMPLNSTINADLAEHVKDSKIAGLHYFRSTNGEDKQHVVQTSASTGTFYHSTELEDVSKVWKTGFSSCKSSGSMAPHYDDNIPIDCK